ncbi:MAG: VOC family protein [Planctomycetota bacterium]
MNFRYTILYVQDVANTLDFYTRAFGLERGLLHESGDYGELKTGTTKLAFSSLKLMRELGKSPKQPDAAAPAFEIAFETTEVAGALQRAIDAGAELVQPVEQMPWGQETAYVRDRDGFLVEICSPVNAAQ